MTGDGDNDGAIDTGDGDSDSEPVARAACVVRSLEELLVEETVDSERGFVFRPVTVDVATGETTENAVRRAFSDLLGIDLAWMTALGTYDGVRVLEASADQAWLYDDDGFTIFDPDSGETTRLAWLHREDFEKYGETLEPEGLLDAL